MRCLRWAAGPAGLAGARWCSGLSSALSRRIELFEQLQIARTPPAEGAIRARVRVGTVDPVEVTSATGTPRDLLKHAKVKGKVAAVQVDGHLWDLNTPVPPNSVLAPLFADSHAPDVAAAMAHSAAHVLGAALEALHPGILLTNGPGHADGKFFYEGCVDRCDPAQRAVGAAELKALEAHMKRLVRADHPFERIEVTEGEAREVFADNPFKQHYITQAVDRAPEGPISLYRCGPFVDLCRGPHVASTGLLKGVALLSANSHVWDTATLAEVGWSMDSARGTEGAAEGVGGEGSGGGAEMQRVHGVALHSGEALVEWRRQQKELAERSHRTIGTQQELFMMHPVSPGAPFFLPHGTRILSRLKRYLHKKYAEQGYDEVMTPSVFSKALWQQSGHWDHYDEDMFFVSDSGHSLQPTAADGEGGVVLEKGLKPMNCPAHCLIFSHRPRSYRELPVRIADFSALHRNESSGALSGLTRVREFHQDDGHVFCAPEHIFTEVQNCLSVIREAYGLFGFEYTLQLSTRPDPFLGSAEVWDQAEARLREALDSTGERWTVDDGGGAFYGPKIDVTLRDALGRHHQTATIQLDFQLPTRFDLSYTDEHGESQRPVIVHRALLGSLERFFAILCEHTAGKWPLWLSPRQVVVCSVSAQHAERAREVHRALVAAGIHADLECGDEPLGRRLRRVRPMRHNYTVVIGDAEVESGAVTPKARGAEEGASVPLAQFIADLHAEQDQVL